MSTKDDSPLKNLVEPGQHLVEWHLPGDHGESAWVPGSIDLAANLPPSGSMWGVGVQPQWTGDGGAKMAAFPQRIEHKHMFGNLQSGHSIWLTDVAIEIWFPQKATISARCAFVGHIWEDMRDSFQSIRIQTTYLDRVASVPPIGRTEWPADKTQTARQWTVIENENCDHVWESPAATLRLGFDRRSSVSDPYEFSIKYSPVVTMHLREPRTLDQILKDWIDPIKNLVSLSMGTPSKLTLLSLRPDGEWGPGARVQSGYAQLFGSGISQQPFAAGRGDGQGPQPVIKFGEGAESLLDILERWALHTGDGHPLFDTYASLSGLSRDHPRSRFLLLVQALEGHYGRTQAGELKSSRQSHQRERSRCLESMQTSNLDAKSRKFVRSNLSKNPHQSLETVLRWAVKPLQASTSQRLGELTLVQQVIAENGNDIKQGDWAAALRTARNDLTHGNRSYDRQSLQKATEVLDLVVRAHVLRTLGVSDELLKRMLEPE